jgi:uncharacterized protein (TIGR03118 family)
LAHQETVEMGDHNQNRWQAAACSLACAATAAVLTACGGYGGNNSNYTPPTAPPVTTPPPTPSAYSMTSLVSDGAVASAKTDSNLKNPWGLVMAPGLPAWVANNATQSATIYDGTGQVIPLVVSLPGGINGDADVTGMIVNPFTTTNPTEFVVSTGTASGPARFIMDGEGGTILAWAPAVDTEHANIAYDDGTGGAVYKGLAIASANGSHFLYATDFHNNKVDVFDSTFHKVTFSGGFTDPTLPANYAPFGIQALQIGNQTLIYVTYAQRQSTGDDNANGAGLGLVNVFDTSGTLLKHLVPAGGALNAPWGVALAPTNFGNTLSNMVLIGNFGDGVINAYNPDTGAFVDSIKSSAGQPIANPGLWGIAFGNGARNQPATALYFTAGIASEADGLYGRIDVGATPPDAVAPTVSITAPTPNATVSGTVILSADARDNVGVTSVEFFANTTSLGKVTTAPFNFNWNTTTVANGAVSLTAVASDAAGNTTTSPNVGVIVSNTAPAPPPAATLGQLQTSIFTPRCSGCHTGGGTQLPGSMNLSSASATFASLVNVASEENPALKRVAPNDPANSYLIHKLTGTDIGTTARMPFGGPFLDQATIDQVSSWISAGAQNN